ERIRIAIQEGLVAVALIEMALTPASTNRPVRAGLAVLHLTKIAPRLARLERRIDCASIQLTEHQRGSDPASVVPGSNEREPVHIDLRAAADTRRIDARIRIRRRDSREIRVLPRAVHPQHDLVGAGHLTARAA